jgi:hypothetical protein
VKIAAKLNQKRVEPRTNVEDSPDMAMFEKISVENKNSKEYAYLKEKEMRFGFGAIEYLKLLAMI